MSIQQKPIFKIKSKTTIMDPKPMVVDPKPMVVDPKPEVMAQITIDTKPALDVKLATDAKPITDKAEVKLATDAKPVTDKVIDCKVKPMVESDTIATKPTPAVSLAPNEPKAIQTEFTKPELKSDLTKTEKAKLKPESSKPKVKLAFKSEMKPNNVSKGMIYTKPTVEMNELKPSTTVYVVYQYLDAYNENEASIIGLFRNKEKALKACVEMAKKYAHANDKMEEMTHWPEQGLHQINVIHDEEFVCFCVVSKPLADE